MSFIYKPRHQYQLRPGSAPTGGYDCTAYAAAMAIDRHTMGGVRVTGRQVRLASNEPTPDPDSPGLNIPQIIQVAATWHVELIDRRGAPWSAVLTALREGRGVILQGDAEEFLGTPFVCQTGFRGDHAIYLNHETGDGDLYHMDPLCRRPNANMEPVIARRYAEKLARNAGTPGRLFFATTRITPNVALASDA